MEGGGKPGEIPSLLVSKHRESVALPEKGSSANDGLIKVINRPVLSVRNRCHFHVIILYRFIIVIGGPISVFRCC